MFEGGFLEQFHHFMIPSSTPTSSSSSPTPSSLALSFPLHIPPPSSTQTFPITPAAATCSTFEFPYPVPPPVLPLLQLDLPHKVDDEKLLVTMIDNPTSRSLELQRDRRSGIPDQLLFDPWTNDEVLALLRIRSSIQSWLPDFTWEHVSRKLAELGYRRSGEICKQKFEEESSRHFDSLNSTYAMKNYYTRPFFSELEEFCHGENSSHVLVERNQNIVVQKLANREEEEEEDVDNVGQQQISLVEDSRNETLRENDCQKLESKKRKRHSHHRRKFKMLKGFCEDILNKMVAQQEDLHNRIIEDMLKREEEKIAREEAWKKQEIERIDKEVEIRAHEQAIASDRQTKLIALLNNFTPKNSSVENHSSRKRNHATNDNFAEISKGGTTSISSTSCSILIQPDHQNPNQVCQPSDVQNPSFMATEKKNPGEILENENPSSTLAQIDLTNNRSTPQKLEKEMREDLGKRWPRDEVLALINLRCSSQNSSEDKELGGGGGGGAAKGPLWERISQRMLELGYKRSAKRCKEKWENINKYFRKTKDVNKKRSVDSRTCPYFHQLNTLYAQGTSLVHLAPPGQDDGQENHSLTAEANLEV